MRMQRDWQEEPKDCLLAEDVGRDGRHLLPAHLRGIGPHEVNDAHLVAQDIFQPLWLAGAACRRSYRHARISAFGCSQWMGRIR